MLNVIDISNWQPSINIGACTYADAVIVKATEGLGYVSPTFHAQVAEVIKSGKLLGVYHFASGLDAVKEAEHFYKEAKPYAGRAIFILDFESKGVLNAGVEFAAKFLATLEGKLGYRPFIYMNTNCTKSFNWSAIAKKYNLWLAEYPAKAHPNFNYKPELPQPKYWSAIAMWQYCSDGRIVGYENDLDLSHFFGTKEEWQMAAGMSVVPAKQKAKTAKYECVINLDTGEVISMKKIG